MLLLAIINLYLGNLLVRAEVSILTLGSQVLTALPSIGRYGLQRDAIKNILPAVSL